MVKPKICLITHLRLLKVHIEHIQLVDVLGTEFSRVQLHILEQSELLEGTGDELAACECSLHVLARVEPVVLLRVGYHLRKTHFEVTRGG